MAGQGLPVTLGRGLWPRGRNPARLVPIRVGIVFTVLAYIHDAILPSLVTFCKEYTVRNADIPKIFVIVNYW